MSKKRENPKFSCRKLVSLIKEEFKVEISKSSINKIIKANSLSNRIGRPGIRQKTALSPLPRQEVPSLVIIKEPAAQEKSADNWVSPKEEPVFEAADFYSPARANPEFEKREIALEPEGIKSIEFRSTSEPSVLIESGGAIFLLMVDYKFGLTGLLAQKISICLPGLSEDALRVLIQLKVYKPLLKDEANILRMLGKEPAIKDFDSVYERLAKLPFNQLNADLISLGLPQNINEINDLYQKILICLNKKAQQSFFPSVYQFLDLSAMRDRFYSLAAKIERKDSMINVQFLYPLSFNAICDIVWQDDFKFAVSSINKERVFTPEGQLFKFEETLAAYQ
ncbi:MAG: hypothetical protein NTY14_02365 [Candidatus Omnitrophica bacterium]|nr:hypothetical protein [Candidatus Omnitrophota bacterium]